MNKDIIKYFIENGFLISPDLNDFDNLDSKSIINIIFNAKDKPSILNKDIIKYFTTSTINKDINWVDFDKSRADFEKGRNKEIYKTFLDILEYDLSEEKKTKIDTIMEEIKKDTKIRVLDEEEQENGSVIVLKSYIENINKKREIQDFVKYYRVRYEKIKNILLNRVELQNTISINKLKSYENKESSIIGFVIDKRITKNNHIILTLEDSTGIINLLINQNKKEIYEMGKDIVLDDIIGVVGVLNKDIIFVNNIYLPDIPYITKTKKSKEEVYVVFISDIHIGLKNFMEEEFDNFIKWLGSSYGNNEQRELAKKVKYLFIIGDMIDGVGVYPSQEGDLLIKDVYKQCEKLKEFLIRIPKNIDIIICPGNHDPVRVAEPQPSFNEKVRRVFQDLTNIKWVTNPSLVNIHSSKNFEGFNVLMYHGFSFPYYAENVESIRLNGGMDRSDLIMKFLLQRRHLAPTHGSNQYIPDVNEDPLVIDTIPDIFATGHIHKIATGNYKDVICLNCSCWSSQTKDQEKRGIIPDPAKAILLNLSTRSLKIMNFIK